MKTVLLIVSIIPLAFGAPFTSDNNGMFPTNDEESFSYVDLTNGVEIAWKVERTELSLSFKIPKNYRWMVVGFTETTEKDVSGFDQAMFFRIRSGRLSVKSADWTIEEGFLASVEPVWDKESESETSSIYIVSANRPITGLKTKSPIRLVYGYGTDKHFNDINSAFKNVYDTKPMTLNKPGTFLQEEPMTTKTTKGIDLTPIKTAMLKSTQEATSPTTLTTSTTSTTSTNPIISTTQEAPVIVKSTQEPTQIIERAKFRPTFKKTIKPTLKKNPPTLKHGPSTTAKGSPCPTKCNCTKETNQKDSHWYDVIRAKENSTYFAIIGASALFTAVIVLVVACCCARSSGKPPRARKHKVAFYKVDDFDSADEEEIDLIENEKQRT